MSEKNGSRSQPRERTIRTEGREIVAVGLEHDFWSDLYHRCMTASWPVFAVGAIGVFLGLNCLFAGLYLLGTEPIANVPPGEPMFLIYFSFQTLSTVGYGNMYPQTHYGNLVAGLEMFTGLVYAAVMTGLVFQRFARSRARFVFARQPLITVYDGRPTLIIRVANARHNLISNASAKLWLLRLETTPEGHRYRRFHQLRLTRDENPSFVLSWSIFHTIDETSLLHGLGPEDLLASEASLILSVAGQDEAVSTPVNARRSYASAEIGWNQRYADILEPDGQGRIRINYNKFDDIVPLTPPGP